MYHDTIHITFESADEIMNYKYTFLISKKSFLPNHNPITYQEILDKMESYGFNIEFLDFPDIEDKSVNVYCSYNLTPDFNVFFKAYERVLKPRGFNISFEYGSMINGEFCMNNMNFYSGIYFKMRNKSTIIIKNVIKDVDFYKHGESYQIVDKNGKIVDAIHIRNFFSESYDEVKENFFKSRKVTQYLRKYKLERIKNLNLP